MKHKIKHIHFVGIGGSGMSGIAEVLLNLGYKVSGSDLGSNAASHRLKDLGARVYLGHHADNILGADAVVTSTAVNEANPEVMAARSAQIPVVPRAIMLGELMRLKRGIAIAGTHGKTTTTSLVASVLAQGGLDPTFVIGGKLNSAGANAKLGTGDYIVAEADESDASFLNLTPMIEVITNIDADHMETYEHDFEKLKSAFVNFTHRLPFYGRVMLCIDDKHVRSILPQVTKPVTTYGFAEDAQVRALDAYADGVHMHFTVRQDGYPDTKFVLNQPGMHNVLNACSAIAIAREIGIDDAATAQGLLEFRGVGRRFTRYGEVAIAGGGSFTLVDDFGHHPVETEVTLAAARAAYPGRRLVLAFQPHRYSRTRDLFEDFVKVLAAPDVLLLAEVYPAGEAPIVAADGRALARSLRAGGKIEPIFVETIAEMPAAILQAVKDGDVVLTMGAGSISGVPGQLTEQQTSQKVAS
ncbi:MULTISPECIES: UDP-N-acetylmuramate--L-alanine ligase [unclassified Massilia]|uniref:UDP-N-acetylmuramate--L-alanine ligase n=1 Tax=unclassified Massilia TaxID=2609279 RepID=UPI001780CC73|nr:MULTISPECIES: UDP-N-acetylmuramate--L-alanine ligase [unclassified Massilia]MBD8529173.1 UDP-N-acetylmuramate--L-alanine ligase [Massilia sp. CFBP 13647]MBD8672567.1 UDP-N-acetylmuramate--L-alanine ligase [Massilia sp. CFBP 13721]